jgi:two-component system, NarL family, sensor histidine kinase UhpB
VARPAYTIGAFDAERDASAEIRRALARELHDRVVQTLTTMLIELENFKAEQTGRKSVLRQLDEIQDSTRDVLDNMRRVLYGLRDEEITEAGFTDAVRTLLSRFQERTQVAVRFTFAPAWPPRLRASAALNLYRIIEEALTNIRMHSGAGRVDVSLAASDGNVAVEVRDNGNGGSGDGNGRRPGLGVMGMHERALLLGGRLEIESVDGRGTTIRVTLPKEQLI